MKILHQDFINDNVEIEDEGQIINCFMFMDEYGDIYFEYKGKPIYFRDIKGY